MADKKKNKPTAKKPSSKKPKLTKPKDKKSRSGRRGPLTDIEREAMYPGITEQIKRFENANLPPCPHCRSKNTASVQVGVIGRTISISANTQKFKLVFSEEDKLGEYFCNDCKKFFDTKKTKSSKAKKKVTPSEPRRVYRRLDFSSLEAYRQSVLAFVEAMNGESGGDNMTDAEWQAAWKVITRRLKAEKARKKRKSKKQ